jgi:hypothetical protein
MRVARKALGNRRVWAGLALGAALAVLALAWNRGSHEGEASALASGPPASKPIRTPPPTSEPGPRAPAESASAPAGFAHFQDYFDRNYYASYFYASPAVAPADWSRNAPPSPPDFTLPSVADVLEPGKLPAPLPLPPIDALGDTSRLAPAATLSISPPSSAPIGPLTNNTPFHLFVTSEPVSAAASTASGAPSATGSGGVGGVSAGGATGAVTGTVGSLLRK